MCNPKKDCTKNQTVFNNKSIHHVNNITSFGTLCVFSPLLLDSKLAAAYLSISVSHFNALKCLNGFPKPVVFPSKKVLWKKEDLDDYIESLQNPEQDNDNEWDEVL